MRAGWFLLLIGCLACRVYGQMNFNGKEVFGNEWISSAQAYLKIPVRKDGMYRLDYRTLDQAGVPLGSVRGSQFKMHHLGEEISLYVSTDGFLSESDYILFYGTQNRGELDKPLFNNPEHQLNAEYSMFTDEAMYFLSWSEGLGKRIAVRDNDLSNPIPADAFYLHRSKIVFTDYSWKRAEGRNEELKLSYFTEQQGYGSTHSAEKKISLHFSQFYAGGPDAQLTIRHASYGELRTSHRIRYFLDNQYLDERLYSGFKVVEPSFVIPNGDLDERMELKITANANPEDNVFISVIQMAYPRKFVFEQQKSATMYIGGSIIRKLLILRDFNGGDEITFYDRSNQYFIRSRREADGTYHINLPPDNKEREIFVFNSSEVMAAVPQGLAQFESLDEEDADYLIIYHSALADDGRGNNYVQEYIDYRQSQEGGNYRVKALDIERLYDQFAYGIHTHPLAIRNAAQYLKSKWPSLKFALILGKGLEYPIYRKKAINKKYFFVPSFSYPASDLLLFADRQDLPMLAFGRVPAISGTEIKHYLDKVKSHESYVRSTSYSIESREWIKNVVHLSGGDPNIYGLIRSQLALMEQVIVNNSFGANLYTFLKENSGPTQVATNEFLKSLINNGSSIISFMGHSGAVRLDFNLENVDSYKNKDRYHLFIAMGCYAGQMFWENRSISEEHNLAHERGSIVYIANTTAGYPDVLGFAGSEFYRQLGGRYFGHSLGEANSVALKELLIKSKANQDDRTLSQALSTIFNGDPAIKLNINTEQDYLFDPKTAIAEPSLLFASAKDFNFKIDLVNLGKFIKDSVLVTVENEMPDGKRSVIFDQRVATVGGRRTLEFKIPILGEQSIGYNTLYLTVDGDNRISEGPDPDAERNNELEIGNFKGYKYYVIGNDARPVFPTEFAIVNQSRTTLIACNGNTFAKQSNYFFELDTSAYFNSPLKLSKTVNQIGGVIAWNPNRELLPNTVYYWRIAPDSSGSGILGWRTSSFIYIPDGSKGWNQSHYFQFLRNDLIRMKLEEPKRNFEFSDQIIEIRANNGYIELPSFIRPRVYIGSDVGIDYEYWKHDESFSGALINVFDPITGRPWVNKTGSDFGSHRTSGEIVGKPIFVFKTNTQTARARLLEFLRNDIPDNHVVIFNMLSQRGHSYFAEDWENDGPNNLMSLLENFGSKEIRNLVGKNSPPYTLIFRKGRPDFEVKEAIGDFENEIDISHKFTTPLFEGAMESRLVGPAKKWDKFLWDFKSQQPGQDLQAINIYGIGADGNATHLYGPFTSLEQDLNHIDARRYRQLRLEWKSEDRVDRTPTAMQYWRVLYEGLPDAAFLSARDFVKSKDTLNQGNTFRVSILAQNVSDVPMDSLLVKFTLVSTATNVAVSKYRRFGALAPQATIPISYEVKTNRTYGNFKLFIELNPDNDQPESNFFNNTAIVDFHVRRDRRRPWLDITFDGQRISNQEIVSSRPTIEIQLDDENPDNFLNDTSLMKVFIKYPDNSLQRIFFASPNVEYVLGGPSQNQLKMIYRGEFNEDGVYSLKVEAEDASGNAATEGEYAVDFTIINKSRLSNVVNYPNPFSTRTKFVYTLTGNYIPSQYSLQIMTVSGKVVREITQDEMGPLRIGTNMTEFEYDGTDDFGEKLANGVYLYRFNIRDQRGKSFERHKTKADSFFQHELGKMVIIR